MLMIQPLFDLKMACGPDLNQCWRIIAVALNSKLKWNIGQKCKHLIGGNAIEHVVCKYFNVFG